MQIVAAFVFGLLLTASIVVGVRLLLLHRQTGSLPELLLGGMLVLVCGLAYPLRVAFERGGPDTLLLVSEIGVSGGFSLMFVFTWRVFRPQETWARVLVAAGLMALLAKAVQTGVRVHGHGAIHVRDLALSDILLQTAPIFAVYLWTALESFRYYAMMRRRMRLGLADAVVSDRFLLWGLMSLCALVGVVVSAGSAVIGRDVNDPVLLLMSSITALGQLVFLLLALLPPKPYVGWVRARAGAAAGA